MNIQAVETLAHLVANSTVFEVSIQIGQDSISVKNFQSVYPTATMQTNAVAKSSDAPINHASAKNTLIRSTHIGWVRLAGDTIATPLVKVGDSISVGQTLAFIGVLGKLEPVVSKQAGKVKAILIENEQPVEYGMPLFELEK